jgi:hypothetical protein
VLFAAQPLRLIRRKDQRAGSVGPFEAAFGGHVERGLVSRAESENAAFALDHDVARIGGRGADSGLAESPACQDQPAGPVSFGGMLVRAPPKSPVEVQRPGFRLTQTSDRRPDLVRY